MPATYVIDGFYLTITAIIAIALNVASFFVAYTFQVDKLTDFTGGTTFFTIALITVSLSHQGHARQIVASVFVMLWAVRLAGFLLFRILKTGTDKRFDHIRQSFWKFGAFWFGQILWAWTVSLPITFINSPNVSNYDDPPFGSGADVVGIIFVVIALVLETAADVQKFNFKQSKPPKGTPTDVGVWKYSRHPNYFGEILFWWGIWLLTLQPALTSSNLPESSRAALKAGFVSVVFISLLLLFASGMPSDKDVDKRMYLAAYGADSKPGDEEIWPRYVRHRERTSVFWPLPPALWSRLPPIVKKTVGMEWPVYTWDEKKEGQEAIEEDRKKKEKERREEDA